jgi:hypothetical protein
VVVVVLMTSEAVGIVGERVVGYCGCGDSGEVVGY